MPFKTHRARILQGGPNSGRADPPQQWSASLAPPLPPVAEPILPTAQEALK